MDTKKAICLLSVVLMLIGMSCSCNLLKLIQGSDDEISELEYEAMEALQDMEDIDEELLESAEDIVEEAEEQLTEDGANPLGQVGETVEDLAESVVEDVEEEPAEEIPEYEMGTQPNWSFFVTGCEEYFEEGTMSGFYPSETMDEIEFTGDQHMIILSMTKSWRDEQMWFSDFTDNDLTNNNIDFVIYDYEDDSYVFLPDIVSFYWEYDGDEQHIFGVIDFDARAYDSASQMEISPECVVSGQFSFDNIPLD